MLYNSTKHVDILKSVVLIVNNLFNTVVYFIQSIVKENNKLKNRILREQCR